VSGQHGDAYLIDNERLLWQLCYNNALCIMNTFFQDRGLHKYSWYRDSLGQRSLIGFGIVSTDLFRSALDVRDKTDAEMSIDHHLVVCS